MSLTQQFSLDAGTLNALGIPFMVVDGRGDVVRWGERMEAFGITSGEVLNRPVIEALRPLLGIDSLVGSLEGALREAREGRTITLAEVPIDFPSFPGQFFRTTLAPVDDGNGGQAVVMIFQESTGADLLRQQFERILDSTPDGIFVIDPQKRLRLFNRSCGEITGRSPADIMSQGCSCSDVIECHTEEGESYASSLCPAKGVFKGEMTHQREEMLLTNAAGEERLVETMYSAVKNESGEVEYVIGVLRDVHERKLLEERLNQSEKLASLGQLVAGIAHEIKNPLAIILTSLDIVENEKRPKEQRREAAAFLREEIQRLDSRLRAFLAFARPRIPQFKPMVLSSLVRRRVASIAPLYPEINITADVHQPEPILMGDEEQINQVLTNLVLNAAEAIDGGGAIRVSARQQGDNVVLEVEDDGPGIPEEFRARIFDPFFTTKSGGTGLGLSICYQIVLSHNGTISVARPGDGKGGCFTVRLPIRMGVGTASES
ncbi:MAG: PAS domain-containing protein [Candidatus Sumerlaeia bacterium]|nr:PAS domain-containing protein [Candidatus Sumerlaeia bacterium]